MGNGHISFQEVHFVWAKKVIYGFHFQYENELQ